MSIPPDGRAAVTRPRGQGAPDARRVQRTALAVMVGCLAVVALLAVGVRAGFAPQLRLDTAVSRALYAGDLRPAMINGLLYVITGPGYTVARLVLAVPLLVWLLRRGARWTALWVAVAYGLIGPITSLGKYAVARVRPPFSQGGALNHSPSFPSGHSSGIATTVVVGLILAWPLLSGRARRIWVPIGAVIVVLVGFSRMWLGEHYLTDVVAGWSLGIAWALLTAVLFGALPGGRAALAPRT
ncbi:MAG: phosphatase PAP2 family protein [Blastococcus sp.]